MKIDIFKQKRKRMFYMLLFTIFLSIFFMIISDFQVLRFFQGNKKLGFFLKLYFPPTIMEYKIVLYQLWITIAVSIGSTVVAAVFSFIMSLFVSDTLGFNRYLGGLFNGFGLVCRNIPIYVWQLLLGMVFYMGGFFLAFLIIFLISVGFLIRVFKETIDETSGSSIEALKATGASRVLIIKNAIIPDTLAQLVSWTLFCIETNIRSSSLIGYLTGAGIGYLISYYRGFKRDLHTTLGLVIVVALSLIIWDLISNKLRRIILNED